MRRMLAWYDSGKEMKEFHITLLDAMVILKDVLEDKVSAETIRNCFRHCGFFHSPSVRISEEDEEAGAAASEDLQRLQTLEIVDQGLDVDDVEAVDEELITSHYLMEENITEEEDEDEDDCGDPPPWVTTQEADAAVQILKAFYLQHGIDTATICTIETLITQRVKAIKQSTLDSFFERK